MIIDTIEKSYTLGFLWADGHLDNKMRLSININKSDGEALKDTFVAAFGFHIYAHKKNVKHPTWQEQLCFHKTNKKQFTHLTDLSFKDKSHASQARILGIVPEDLKHYFWRGYFDGDGCVYVRRDAKLGQISISSSYEQDWSYMLEVLGSLGITGQIKKTISPKGHKSSMLRITDSEQQSIFMKYIYPNGYDGIGLWRKFSKLEELHTSWNNKQNKKNHEIDYIRRNAFTLLRTEMMAHLGISTEKLNRLVIANTIDMPHKNYWSQKRIANRTVNKT
jgi:hypothetical protein